VDCYPLIRFPIKSVPTDPEEVYEPCSGRLKETERELSGDAQP
jgi:hypothetical protein